MLFSLSNVQTKEQLTPKMCNTKTKFIKCNFCIFAVFVALLTCTVFCACSMKRHICPFRLMNYVASTAYSKSLHRDVYICIYTVRNVLTEPLLDLTTGALKTGFRFKKIENLLLLRSCFGSGTIH